MLEPNANPQKHLLEASKIMPHLVLLEGEAGMGKTHALERTAADLKHALLVGASGWLNQVLSKARALLTDERDPAFLTSARLIAPEANWAQVAQAPVFSDRESLWRSIAQALERLARRLNGLTLLLEDGHAMSEDDVLALRVVYRRAKLGNAPLLIVLSSRPTEKDLLEGFVQDAVIANASELERLTLSSFILPRATTLFTVFWSAFSQAAKATNSFIVAGTNFCPASNSRQPRVYIWRTGVCRTFRFCLHLLEK